MKSQFPTISETTTNEGTSHRREYDVEFEALKVHCIDPKIQQEADILHAANCDQSHYDRCDYHYGNWNTNPRMVMFEWYKKAEALKDRGVNFDQYQDALAVVDTVTKIIYGEK